MQDDVIIVGGSFAGLSAALYLARARRSVCIVDAGRPRNRFADESHGFFGHDGSSPQAMLGTARAQVGAYPTVRFIQGTAVDARKVDGNFSVTLDSGEVLTGSNLVLAFGISDILPDVPGLEERWGKTVIHCPYCHGYEFSGQRLGVLNTSAFSHHQAMLISEWGPTTYFLNGASAPDEEVLGELARRNIAIESGPVEALIGDSPSLSGVRLSDGRVHTLEALFIAPGSYLNSNIAERLGCEIVEEQLGSIVKVDEMRMTTVEHVFAAGDITRSGHNVTWASSDGVMAAMAIHRSLAFGS